MQQLLKLPESWYEHSVQRGPAFPTLRGKIKSHVCVIGGGLAGLTTALELARAGIDVVLLEAARIASGASGRNGGFVSNGFALGVDGIAAIAGEDSAKALYALSREGTEFVRSQIANHAPDVKMGDGWRICVRHQDRGGLARYGAALARDFGEVAEHAETVETRHYLNSPQYFDSLYFPKAFHIHPLRYALLLARLAVAAGAVVHEHAPVCAVEKLGSRFRVSTDEGEVDVAHVVNCVSAFSKKLHRPTGRAVLPVATYIAVTEPVQQQAINTTSAVADTRRAGDYYRLIDGDRILWGGRITTRVSEPRKLAEEMQRDMRKVFPQLGNPNIDFAWSGLMGYALHKMPLIGRDGQGQWFATAFGGHGLNTTAMAGGLIARAIAHGDDSYRQFAPFAPRWAFGPLGRLGVQGSYWWMQAKDHRDEALRR